MPYKDYLNTNWCRRHNRKFLAELEEVVSLLLAGENDVLEENGWHIPESHSCMNPGKPRERSILLLNRHNGFMLTGSFIQKGAERRSIQTKCFVNLFSGKIYSANKKEIVYLSNHKTRRRLFKLWVTDYVDAQEFEYALEYVYGFEIKCNISLALFTAFLRNAPHLPEQVLRLTQDCDWLLPWIAYNSTKVRLPQKSLREFFHMTSRKDVKEVLSEEDDCLLCLYLALNMHGAASLSETKNVLKTATDKFNAMEFEGEEAHCPCLEKEDMHLVFFSKRIPRPVHYYSALKIYEIATFSSFINYIREEHTLAPDLSFQDMMILLEDCNRMEYCMEYDWDDYDMHLPHNLRASHDETLIRYREYYDSDDAYSMFSDTPETIERMEMLYRRFHVEDNPGSIYSVVIPERPSDIRSEGAMLGHCVGSYVPDVISGKCWIFFLREKSDLSKSLITFEVRQDENGYVINQIRGYHNRDPKTEEREYIENWLQKVNAGRGNAFRVPQTQNFQIQESFHERTTAI